MINQLLNSSRENAWQFRQSGTIEWLDGHAPGGVHTDLLALGKIPDPFVGDNEKAVHWISETDWEYRLVFTLAPGLLDQSYIYLACDGLDTLAEVYLNGRLVGNAQNMFRQYSWEVKEDLLAGANELLIHFSAPFTYVQGRYKDLPLPGGGDLPGGPYLRKAPSQWGWDWGPKLPPIGVWKDIALQGYHTARLNDVHVRQQHTAQGVKISANVVCERWQPTPLTACLQVTAPDGQVQTVESEVNTASVLLSLPIARPQLWWPNGYGAQPLYQVQVALFDGQELLDTRSYQVGLRTIELRRQPDQWGESFTFVVNGVPIFAKGADWIPADSFPTRLTLQHFEKLLGDAALAHMNMLRVWGGGFYEDEHFYDVCDRLGILVWQDFVFACGVYPDDPAFFENVRVEAIQNVRRLRQRASLAIWCGNNEMEQGWADWGWNRPDPIAQRLKSGYDRMFHHLLPAVVASEDPDRPYWPSSASSGIPFANPNSQERGDVHYWDVWHGRKPFTAYRSQFPRFMSEFGFQALPPLETIATYAEPKDWNMTSYIMEHHQRSGSGNGLMIGQMTDTFRMPNNFPSLVYLSMVLQAEGIRYGVEHWRRNMQRVSGTLIWQLNDCWPVASWSSLDYFGRWKALHYAAKRFYAPVLLSVEDSGAQMNVHVTSDLTQPWQGSVRWTWQSLAGQVFMSGETPINAAPLANTPVCQLDFSAHLNESNRRNTVFTCELWQGDQFVASCVNAFVPNKHLELVDPQINVGRTVSSPNSLSLQVSAKSLARFVQLGFEGADVVFSDNYFDLPAGSTRTITCARPKGWTLEQAFAGLKVRSLYDSFA